MPSKALDRVSDPKRIMLLLKVQVFSPEDCLYIKHEPPSPAAMSDKKLLEIFSFLWYTSLRTIIN
jgi:hypothetical protein